jgi:hypothetical protein
MSTIDRLLSNYSRQVRLPWSLNVSGKQRTWFAVYPPAEERRVRARLPQFEALTLEANLDEFPYEAEQSAGFRPYRRRTKFFKSRQAPVQPLLQELKFSS